MRQSIMALAVVLLVGISGAAVAGHYDGYPDWAKKAFKDAEDNSR